MDFTNGLWNGIRTFFQRDEKEAELDAEIRHHIELETEKNIREGMGPVEARRKALLDFGGVDRFKEKTRESWGISGAADTLAQDLRFAYRSLKKRPGFSLLAVLSLALGIGANTTVFPVLSTFFIKPLDLQESERLYHLSGMDLSDGMLGAELSWAEFDGVRETARTLDGSAAYTLGQGMVVRGTSEPLFLNGARVSTDLFGLLGIPAAMGRTFLPEDEAPGSPPVTVLSHGLWSRAFGEDPRVLGRTVIVDEMPRTIVGVLPPDREFPEILDLWVPVQPALEADLHKRDWEVVVRLAPGERVSVAQAELEGIVAGLEAQRPPEGYTIGPRLNPLKEAFLVPEARGSILVMYLLVSMVLLVACFNVGTLLLARGADRGEEMAVRAGLGAGRGRILQQLLVESALLALLGALPGVYLGLKGTGWMVSSVPIRFPGFIDFSLDPLSVCGLAGLVVLAGIVAGLWPALQASRPDLANLLRGQGPMTGSALASGKGRSVLVVGQISLTLAVMVAAGVLLKGMVSLQTFDPGYDPESLVGVYVDLEEGGVGEGSERLRVLDALKDRMAMAPGVESVTVGSRLPIMGQFLMRPVGVTGIPQEGEMGDYTLTNQIYNDFFQVLGMSMAEGRGFDSSDGGSGSPPVAVVDRAFADRWWPGEGAVGKSLYMGGPGVEGTEWEAVEVVGVVETARWIPPRRDVGTVFRPFGQDPGSTVTLIARTSGEPEALVEGLERAVREVAPSLPIHWTETASSLIRQRNWTTDLFGILFNVMALFGTLMATVGIFGLMADSVSRRTREFGIRVAVGASPGHLRRLALGQGGRLVGTGLGIGLLLGLVLTQSLRGLVIGVTFFDPLISLTAAAVTGGTAMLAAYLPALRASRVNPIQALKSE